MLVGTPNVGKSVIFNYLTGRYANVSNYPGTTVEIARGDFRFDAGTVIIDTPGLYSLSPLTEEEEVTRSMLFSGKPEIVVHVADAKNIRRMLNLTLELLDAGLPVILDINLIDEAAAAGVMINYRLLSQKLGIPVVDTAAVKKYGLNNLVKVINGFHSQPAKPVCYGEELEKLIARISSMLEGHFGVSGRIIALLLIQGDPKVHAMIRAEKNYERITILLNEAAKNKDCPLAFVVAAARQSAVDNLLIGRVRYGGGKGFGIKKILDRLTRQPLTGIPILLLVLYIGLYKIVGGFGAGTLVNYIDTVLFGQLLCPAVNWVVEAYLPWDWLKSMLIGDYGLFSLGLRYAVAIILPIVGTFFVVFAILEDCGYLPRLAMLMDWWFKKIGLNGRAVIPVTLGLGCGTMAVFVARTLETRRERILATFLLALAIPCSAQLGLVLALLHDSWLAAIWAGYILLVFLLAGWLSAKLVPGERSPFYMEIPPLRLPSIANVLTKAYSRMIWYFAEIIPVFVVASLFMWLGDIFGILTYIISALETPFGVLGLPRQAAEAFLLGFFRRDYGAAGLYNLAATGLLSKQQLLTASVALTLFVPCIAQVLVMFKERGGLTTAVMLVIIMFVAFSSGWLMHAFSPFLPL